MPRSTVRLSLMGVSLLLALGCEQGDNLARSCAGERVELCGPNQWAELSEASMSPERLPIADFVENARVQVTVESCEGTPHVVELSALVADEDPSPDGGGVPVRVMSLVNVADGADGDSPGDGRIDVEIPNPLIATIPENADITLRFAARADVPGGCTSGVVEIPYRTGPRRQ